MINRVSDLTVSAASHPDISDASDTRSHREHLFETGHLLQHLHAKTIVGGLLTVSAEAAKFALNLISAVVLARLLSPEDFGLVSMVLAITLLLGLFKDAGLTIATVQRETVTHDQVSVLFWINLVMGTLVCLGAVLLAPLVSWFYADQRLTHIMCFLSVTFILAGSTVQHHALMLRQMRFQAIALIDVTSMFAGVTVACVFAAQHFGYWSLVAMHLCTAGFAFALTWWASGWRPSLPARRTGVTPLLSFGLHLTVADLVARFARTSDSILIGRFCGAETLGLYSRAGVLLARPMEQLLGPVSSVIEPALSRLQSDPLRYRRTFLRTFESLVLIAFLFSAVCLAASEPVVLLLLGAPWAGAVPLFAAFALVAPSLPLLWAAGWLFRSQGRGQDQLIAYVAVSLVTVGAYVTGLRWGPVGLILVFAASAPLLRLPIMFHLAGRKGPVGVADLWLGFARYIPCWVAAFTIGGGIRRALADTSAGTQLLLTALSGLIAGVLVVLAVERTRRTARDLFECFGASVALLRLPRGR